MTEKMTTEKAMKLFGKKIYTFALYDPADDDEEVDRLSEEKGIIIYEDKVWAVGEDFIVDDNDALMFENRIHGFEQYNSDKEWDGDKWFTDKNKCLKQARIDLLYHYPKDEE